MHAVVQVLSLGAMTRCGLTPLPLQDARTALLILGMHSLSGDSMAHLKMHSRFICL